MGTLSNKERIDGILMRARQAPAVPVVDPFADLAPPSRFGYRNPGRLENPEQEDALRSGGPVSSSRFDPPSAPAGSFAPFNADEAWNAGPGFRRGRTRPEWWPEELDAYRDEDVREERPWREGVPQQSAVMGLINPQREPAGDVDVWGEALRDARVNEGMLAEADDTPLDQASLNRLRGETAAQDYSPLSEEWGWLDAPAGLATAVADTAPDLVMQYFDADADQRMRDRRRYLSGAIRDGIPAMLDSWELGDSGDLDWNTQSELWSDREGADNTMDWITGAPGRERRADIQQTLGDMDARSQGFYVEPDLVIEGESPTLGERALAVGEDFWQGPSIAARSSRRDAVTGFANADTLREQGDEEGAREAERRAGQSAAVDTLITGAGAIEAAPGVGLIDLGLGAGRFIGRQGLRATGVADNAIPYWMTATDWSPTAAFRGRADEALHDPGMLTRQATGVRDSALVGATAVGAGAYATDELMDGEGGDLNQLVGGGAATAGVLAGAPQVLRGGRDLVMRGLRGADPLADIAPRAEPGAARELDNGARVYEDGYARTTIEPDGRIVHTYQGGFTAGATDARAAGSGGEAVSSMRAAQRALERDISETQRPAYHWFPGDESGAPDPALQEFYRRRFQQNPPPGYVFSEDADGTMHLNRVVEAEASPAAQRRFEAAVRDPETGQVYRGQDHLEAIDSAPDEVVRARLQAAYDAADEDPNVIGFVVDDQFMGREDGLAALRERAGRGRQVRVGEQYNVPPQGTDGLGPVTPRSEIDWDAVVGTNDDLAFRERMSGMPTPPRMNIVPEGGLPGMSADDMLRDDLLYGEVTRDLQRERLYRGFRMPPEVGEAFATPPPRLALENPERFSIDHPIVDDWTRPDANYVVPEGGVPGRSADDMLRDLPELQRRLEGLGQSQQAINELRDLSARIGEARDGERALREAIDGLRIRPPRSEIVSPDGIPGASADDVLRNAPDAPNAGQRRLGDDTAGALAAGAIGGGAVGLALEGDAQASDGGDENGVPMLPILGAGAGLGVATLEAIRRGRLGRGARSQVGMFAGVNARTADRAALERAQQMAASGASRDDIWRDTGWFQGVDGKWRFEIDDSGADVIRTHNGNAYGNLEDGLDHAELYEAYPEMRETRLGFEGDMRASGSYMDARDIPRGWGGMDGTIRHPATIRARGSSKGSLRSTTLHEAQHNAQSIEGFARGGMPEPGMAARLNNQAAARINEIIGNAGGDLRNASPEAQAEVARLRSAQPSDDLNAYERLAGETEARNVQTRRNMTADQRAARAPWETQDVPDDQQIVRFEGDRAESRPARRLGESEPVPSDLPSIGNPEQSTNASGTGGQRRYRSRNDERNARIVALADELGTYDNRGTGGAGMRRENSTDAIAAQMRAEGYGEVSRSTVLGVLKRERDRANAAPAAAVDPDVAAAERLGMSVERYRSLSARKRNEAIAALGLTGGGAALAFGEDADAQEGDEENYLDALDAYGEENDYFGPGWRVIAPRGDIPSVRSLEFVRVEDDGQHAILRDNASGRVFYARVMRDPGGGPYGDPAGMSINVLGEMEPTGLSRSDFDPDAPRERAQGDFTPGRPVRLAGSTVAGLLAGSRVRNPIGGPALAGITAGGVDMFFGGDDAEPVAAGAFASIGRGAGQRFLDDVAIERMARTPEFAAQRDAFARTLSEEAPQERATNPQAGLEMGAGGLELQVPRAEVAEQGYARDLPSGELSPREHFLSLEPREQIAWMESANSRVGRVNDNLAAWEERRAADNELPDLPALSASPSVVDQNTAPTFPVGFYDPATGEPLFGATGRRPPPRAERRPVDELRNPGPRIGRTASDRIAAAREIGVAGPDEAITGAEATRRIMDWGRLSPENMADLRRRFPAIAAMILGGGAAAGAASMAQDPLEGVY